jgi:hypothetical protein
MEQDATDAQVIFDVERSLGQIWFRLALLAFEKARDKYDRDKDLYNDAGCPVATQGFGIADNFIQKLACSADVVDRGARKTAAVQRAWLRRVVQIS